MFVAKVKRVVNPRRSKPVNKKAKKTVVTKRKTTAKRKKTVKRNPVSLLTLGFAGNPRKKKNTGMATKTKRKSAKRSAAAKKAARTRKRNLTMKAAPKRRNPVKRYAKRSKKRNSTRVIVMAPKRNGRRGKRRNPQMFGMNVSAGQAAKMVAAGLVGVTATKLIVPQLPATIVSTPLGAAVSSIAVAIAGGWLIGKWDATLGSAFAFGGLMQAGSIVLNAVPIPGASNFALAGGRGMGYFASASYPVPQIPIVTTGATGVGGAAGRPAGNRAYPRPYNS